MYRLQWGAPAWAGANGSLFTGADIRYLLDWLGCARQYGLTISYLGGWNERDDGSHVAWFRSLRLALNSGGYQNVRIVAGDGVGNAKWVTMAGQGKGTATSPPAADLGLPYRNDLSASAGVPGMPGLLAPQDGAFQLAPCHSLNGSATCTMQAAVGQPVLWSHQVPDRHPDAIIGADWADYSVSVDAMVPGTGSAGLIARYHAVSAASGTFDGYVFDLSTAGSYTLLVNDGGTGVAPAPGQPTPPGETVLARGQASFAAGTWHTLTLSVSGQTIQVGVDGTQLATASDSAFAQGTPGIEAGGWYQAYFSDLVVASL